MKLSSFNTSRAWLAGVASAAALFLIDPNVVVGGVSVVAGAQMEATSSDDAVGVGVGVADDASQRSSNIALAFHQQRQLWQFLEEFRGEGQRDEFGHDISMNSIGTVIAVSSLYNNNEGGQDAGSVRVYFREVGDSVWARKGSDLDGLSRDEEFGFAVALDATGDRLIVGVRSADTDGLEDNGAARIYDFNGIDWVQLGDTLGGYDDFDYLGESVAISGDGNIIAAGCLFGEYARIWILEDDSTWTGFGNERDGDFIFFPNGTIYGDAFGEVFGTSIALSGDGFTIAIGAPYANVTGLFNVGYVRSFRYDETVDEWRRIDEEDVTGLRQDDEFGFAVALNDDGTVLAVGARNTRDGLKGNIEVFDLAVSFEGFDLWAKKGNTISGENGIDYLGSSISTSVALSADGNIVAGGAFFHDGGPDGELIDSGEVRIYAYDQSTQIWELRGAPIDGEAQGDESGWAVALSDNGHVVAIGAPLNNDDRGHARIFDATPSLAPTGVPSQGPTVQPTFNPIRNPLPQFNTITAPPSPTSPGTSSSTGGGGCCALLWTAFRAATDQVASLVSSIFPDDGDDDHEQ